MNDSLERRRIQKDKERLLRQRKRQQRVMLLRIGILLFIVVLITGILFTLKAIKNSKIEQAKQAEEVQKYENRVHTLNSAIDSINADSGNFETYEYCFEVLNEDPNMQEVYPVLDALYERVVCSDSMDFDVESYISVMNRLMDIYEKNPSDELGNEIKKHAVIRCPSFEIKVPDMDSFLNTLNRSFSIGETEEADNLYECLTEAKSELAVFDEAFSLFENEKFLDVRDFIQTDDYLRVRDMFLNKTNIFWKGETYIPVNQYILRVEYSPEKLYEFSFLDFDEYNGAIGVIKIWAAKQEDDGVQRLAISYEPPITGGDYYPHTTYEIIYLYSNVKVDGEYVPMMNYRFETRVLTKEGESTTVYGDFGGQYQWEDEF